MVWTAYLDESGTHDSPIMLMGGYLANHDQWNAFNSDWQSLLKGEGIECCHGKYLHYAAKQFQGWERKRRDDFRLKAHNIVDQRLELGVAAIIRQNDYKDLYKGQPNPGKLREDSKYVVLFRACLLRVESAIVQRGLLTKDTRLDVVLEDGAANAGDARRFFELAKNEHYPEWAGLLGTLTFGQKESCGLQAADLLVYYANKLERKDHWVQPTDIEKSRYASSKAEPARPGFVEYRLPITGDTLRSLAADFQKPPEQWANMQDK